MPQQHFTELRSFQHARACHQLPAKFAFCIYHLSLVHQVELLFPPGFCSTRQSQTNSTKKPMQNSLHFQEKKLNWFLGVTKERKSDYKEVVMECMHHETPALSSGRKV